MTILMSMTLSLTFTQSVKRVLCQKHSSFSGRACRSEYWNFFYFQIIILLIYELFIIMAAIYEIKAGNFLLNKIIPIFFFWLYSLIPSFFKYKKTS